MLKRDNYILIQGFMITDLKLKGNELLVYALIYGFSQDDNSKFEGSLSYISEWLSTSKQTVINTLKSLENKNLIIKEQKNINGVIFNSFRVVKKFDPPTKNNIDGVVKKFDPINNNINNNINNIKEKEIYKEKESLQVENIKQTRFVKPTWEDVAEEYFLYFNGSKEALSKCENFGKNFCDFYESKGWMVGKNHMKDWKCAVRTWIRKEQERKN